jgi:hypothetical protein
MKIRHAKSGRDRATLVRALTAIVAFGMAVFVANPAAGTNGTLASGHQTTTAQVSSGLAVGSQRTAFTNYEGERLAGVLSAPTSAAKCCVPVWYPYGWYKTKSSCTTAGKELVDEIIGAVDYKCTYVSNPPASANGRHYHLYILEGA